ncbi:arginase family protein [Candidatus Woesearchaeota archaeon]|nr:arginase family protein [Candidatus Woesearchaeota archaeon]
MDVSKNLNTKAVLGTFMDAENNPRFDDADVVALGVAFDVTASYGKGAWWSPHAIFDASQQIEWEVPIFNVPLASKVKIHNAGVLEYPRTLSRGKVKIFDGKKTAELCRQMVDDVYQMSKNTLKTGKLLFLMGGEHSILNGALNAMAEIYKPRDVTILQFDAHLDLRDTYWEQKHSHACVMKRARDHGFPLLQIGVRDRFDSAQASFIKKEKRADWIFFCPSQPLQAYYDNAKTLKDGGVITPDNLILNGEISERQTGKILSKVTTPFVWITIDVDGIDSALIQGTGTPMPHGLTLSSVEHTIYSVLQHCHKNGIKLLGFDINEVSPMLRDPDKGYEAANVISTTTEMNAALLASNVVFWNFLDRFQK